MAVAMRNLVNSGMKKPLAAVAAGKALAVLWKFLVAGQSLNHWPTQHEYADYWNETRRTAERDWERFRRAFPTQQSPRKLAELVRAQRPAQIPDDDVTPVAGFPAPEGLLA
jgi:hypothetical protein